MAAWTITVILGALALLQLAVAAGAPLGRFVWGGQHRTLPVSMRIGSLVAIGLYGLFIAVFWTRAGMADYLPADTAGIGTWVITAFFAFGILANAMSKSLPEQVTMTPLNLVLLACALILALN